MPERNPFGTIINLFSGNVSVVDGDRLVVIDCGDSCAWKKMVQVRKKQKRKFYRLGEVFKTFDN